MLLHVPTGASVPAPSLTSLGLLSQLCIDGCEMGKRGKKKASSPYRAACSSFHPHSSPWSLRMPGFGQAWEMQRGICAGLRAETAQSTQHTFTCQGHSIAGLWAGRMSPKLPESCNNSWETAKFHPLTAPVCRWDLLSGMQQPQCPCPWSGGEGESSGPAWGLEMQFGMSLQLPTS